MNQVLHKLIFSILLIFTFNCFMTGFAHSGEHINRGKSWQIQDASKNVQADYIFLKDQDVYLREHDTDIILNFPLTYSNTGSRSSYTTPNRLCCTTSSSFGSCQT